RRARRSGLQVLSSINRAPRRACSRAARRSFCTGKPAWLSTPQFPSSRASSTLDSPLLRVIRSSPASCCCCSGDSSSRLASSSICSLLRICNAAAYRGSVTKTATIRILCRISVLLDSTAAHPTQQPPPQHLQGPHRRNQCNVDHLQPGAPTFDIRVQLV